MPPEPNPRLDKPSETSGRAEEEHDDTSSTPSASVTQSEHVAATSAFAETTLTDQAQGQFTLTSQAAGSTPTPLNRIKSILTATHRPIQSETEDFIRILKNVKNPRIRQALLPPLNGCLRLGSMLGALLEQSRSNLGEFGLVGDMFASYIKDLRRVTARVLHMDLAMIIRRRSREEEEMQRAARKLNEMVQRISTVIEILNLSVQAAESQERSLRNELEQTKERLEAARRRNGIEELPYSDSHSRAERSGGTPSQPRAGVKYLEKLAYLPSKPYQDVPQAHVRRYQNLREYLEIGTAMWLIHGEKFLFLKWFDDSKLPFFSCEGPSGVGKSVIAARVVEWLESCGSNHAYFFLGIGRVQTATGVALALLAQLCAISGYSPSFTHTKRLKKQHSIPRESNDLDEAGPRQRQASRGSPGILFSSMKTSASRATAVLSASRDRETAERRAGSRSPPAELVDISQSGSSKDDQERRQRLGGPEKHVGRVVDSLKTIVEEGTQSVPSLQTLIVALHNAHVQCKSRVFLVLDGWDYDNMIRLEEFLVLLRALGQDGFKIFLTSRSAFPLSDEFDIIPMSLRGGPKLETPPQMADVEGYVDSLLRDHPDSGEITDYSRPSKIIADLSDGIFSFARIITTSLKSVPGSLLRNILSFSSFQEDIRDMVRSEKFIQRGLSFTRESGKDGAADLFMSWLSVTPVPMPSVMLDKVFGKVYDNWKRSTTFKIGDDSEQPEMQSSEKSSEDVSFAAVLEHCQPFVTVDHGNNLVRFTSATVERLAKEAISDTDKTDKRKLAVVAVLETCLDYLDKAGDFPQGCCSTKEELTELLKEQVFLVQAAHFASYLALVRDDDFQGRKEVDEKIVNLFNSQKRNLLVQVFLYLRNEDHDEDKSPSWDAFIHSINSMSELHVAALWGQLKLVKALLEKDKDSATLANSRSSRPLHEAAKSGAVAVVDTILQANPGMVHAVDGKRKTPLFYACRGNHREAIVKLFEAQYASQSSEELGNIDDTGLALTLPKYCLAKSEFRDGTDEALCKSKALVRAIEGGLDVITELLISKGADASTEALYEAVQKGKDNLAATLVSKGADPTAPKDKEPVLHVAASKQMGLTIRELLRHSWKLDINCKDSKGRTALFLAVETGNEEWAMEMTTRFLYNGLDVDILDNDDNHIMHLVAEKGYTEVFAEIKFRSRLIEEPKNKAHKTPFDIAQECNHEGIVTFIRPTCRLLK